MLFVGVLFHLCRERSKAIGRMSFNRLRKLAPKAAHVSVLECGSKRCHGVLLGSLGL